MTPLSASILAARAEGIGRDAFLDFYEAANPQDAAGLQIQSARIGRIGLLAFPDVGWTEFNRGVGFGEPLEKAAFDAVIAWLRRNGAQNWAVQMPSHALSNPIRGWLVEADLAPHGGGWAKHVRDAAPPIYMPQTDLEIRLLKPDAAADFSGVALAGFRLPLGLQAWFAALVGRPRWRVYAAYHGREPVGTGAMFMADELGWLGFDTTLESHRGRGAQSALIAARIADGIALGLRGFVAETARPVPGDRPSFISYRNYQRGGFTVAYSIANYGP